MSVQIFGMAAFRAAVAKGIELAERAARYVSDSPDARAHDPPPRWASSASGSTPAGGELGDRALHQVNRNVLARVFWEERAFMSSTLLRRTFALRMCVINHSTTWDDVRETLEPSSASGREAR